MNFKSLSSLVIQKAEEYQIPLFFTPTVVSFLDLSREISTLILEDQQSEKARSERFKQLLLFSTTAPQSRRQLQSLLSPVFSGIRLPHLTAFFEDYAICFLCGTGEVELSSCIAFLQQSPDLQNSLRMAVSSVHSVRTAVKDAFRQARFASSLLEKEIFSGSSLFFEDTGSHQFLISSM